MTDTAQNLSAINQTIRQQFRDLRRALLISHIRPDGDAVGSLLGLGLALRQAGKEVRMVLADGVPQAFRHLPGSEDIHRSVGDLNLYDYVVILDASDMARIGTGAAGKPLLGSRIPDLVIDHHLTTLDFARTNLILPEQVATSAIVAQYLPDWGLSYNQSIAAVLLSGIITDTIGFRTSNMTPDALRLAAMLMEQGANLPDLYNRALNSKSYAAARYWGQGLVKLQRESISSENGGGNTAGDNTAGAGSSQLVWTSLTLADRQAADYPGNDDADLINLLSSIDCDVAVIFVEQKNDHTKVSWRSRPGIDVSQIALQFGGGGHAAAAGANVHGTLDEVREQVLKATRALLKQGAADKPPAAGEAVPAGPVSEQAAPPASQAT